MADEIRAHIADLYDDPEDFLRRPHPWFGGRSPGEFMATEAGQFALLKFLRGGDHMPPTEPDRDFKPYTTATADHAIDQAIARLEGQIEQLRSLKGSGPEIATVVGRAREVYGEEGVPWLLEYNQVLQTTPLDLVLQGKAERVLTQLGRIEHGVYA
ncbi:MbcA/ParS/Xre antitoxin family protein [Microvirga sp. Mcv34]|uniref:MbcA/ParS/Xre antitoxin family protein n=1 Tax=Microvirga sp. Mcv34 TaxID=2926016 RepID=UPI0021C85050|nr:MbcA/ParS/Xre antitoxin family protein [Microvirga sp. Mcv34]